MGIYAEEINGPQAQDMAAAKAAEKVMRRRNTAWAWDQDKPTRADVEAYVDELRWDTCAYCLSRDIVFGHARDHIEPKSCGGINHWSNLTTACHGCNSSKGIFTLLGFLGRRVAVKHHQEQLRLWRMGS
jgi:HNH endonuclease